MKGNTEKLLDLAFGIAAPAPVVEATPGALLDDLPAKFQRNTHLAIDAAAEIQIKPNPESPNYGTELRAVVAASSNQVNAQLKADEVVVRAARGDDMMKEILKRIAEAEIEEKLLLGVDA